MFEHVGAAQSADVLRHYATTAPAPGPAAQPRHLERRRAPRIGARSFIGRYVFPDGELHRRGDVVVAMQRAGFEVRDVESLREHYAKTLHAWVRNLEAHWEAAVAQVGVRRARVWQLYMAASANGFDDGGISVHQVLGVVPGSRGESGMPATRREWD